LVELGWNHVSNLVSSSKQISYICFTFQPKEIGRAYMGMAKVYLDLLGDPDKAREYKNKAKLVISS
jgi:hypothetical protein